jgi:hypothetical protein
VPIGGPAGAGEIWDGDRGEQADDRNNDHDLDQREAAGAEALGRKD